MKKRVMSIALTAVLCLGLMLAMTACGSAVEIEGKWVLSKMEADGQDFLAMLAEAYGSDFNAEEYMYFEFAKDGKVTLVSDGDTESGTYKQADKMLTITLSGTSRETMVNGNTFSLSMDGMSMTFTKQ